MRELLTCQSTNNQDMNGALSIMLNKQLVEAKSSDEDSFVAAMFRASAFLVTSKGTAGYSKRIISSHSLWFPSFDDPLRRTTFFPRIRILKAIVAKNVCPCSLAFAGI